MWNKQTNHYLNSTWWKEEESSHSETSWRGFHISVPIPTVNANIRSYGVAHGGDEAIGLHARPANTTLHFAPLLYGFAGFGFVTNAGVSDGEEKMGDACGAGCGMG